MLLQKIPPKPPLKSHQEQNRHSYNPSKIPNAISFSSGFLQNPPFHHKHRSVFPNYKARKNPVHITCSSISQVHSYGTIDYEKRPMIQWNAIYKKISTSMDPNMGSASVLSQVENEGKVLTKWELCRIVKELRKFRRFKYALEIYDWMNKKPDKYRVTTSDTAIQLDLIAKVHGISSAEQYFQRLPDALKDKRIYGSLLNAYVRARMREKAESLMNKMRNRGYASHPLPFNVMMTLYTNFKEHEMIESLISEMKEKNVSLDIYTYNIWLTSRGSQGSVERMEQVFSQMQLDPTINPNWTTYSTLATMYIKLDQFEKADDCLRKIESRITGRDRMPYHYLISLYGCAGKKEDVYRIWNVYKSNFVNIPNMGYHTVISALIRTEDIAGAEKIYSEWLEIKSLFDPRIGNLLLSSYVKRGLSEKAETFFDQMIDLGGKPNATTWEILAENHLRNSKILDALSCLRNAASTEGSRSWRPKPVNIANILEISEDTTSIKDEVLEILRQVGCLDDANYMSYIPITMDGTIINSVSRSEEGADSDSNNNEEDYALFNQFQESL